MKKTFLAVSMFLIACTTIYASKPSSSSSSSRPSFSSGRSTFSSGSSSKPTSGSSNSSKPTTTFSSGSSSKPTSGSSNSSKPTTTFSSGNKTYSSSSSNSIKPGKSNFDTIGAKEQTKVESRKLYNKGNETKTEYKTSSGTVASIDPKDKKIDHLRTQLSHERWVNRDLRQQQFYGVYYSRPLVVYHDPYPSFFWWWLLDRSLDERAMWAYHHRYDMDNARYRDMLAKDAQLEARIRQLESQNITRNTAYVPNGMDNDLMYSNEYVDAVYNPAPTVHMETSGSVWFVLKFIFWIGVIVLAIYLVFFYRHF